MQGGKSKGGAAGLQPPNGEAPFLRRTYGASNCGEQTVPRKSPGSSPVPLLLGVVAVFFGLGTETRGQSSGRRGRWRCQ